MIATVRHRIRLIFFRRSPTIQFKVGLLCFMFFAPFVRAQEALPTPPQFSVIPPELQSPPAASGEVIRPPAIAPGFPRATSPFRWGPLNLRPHLTYRFLYGDGIQARPGQPTNTTAHAFSPGVLVEIGSHWSVDYTPTWTFYSSKEFRDTLDHSVSLRGATAYQDWAFGVAQTYASSSTPLIETGSQTDQENYFTAINASRPLSSKMTLDLGVNQSFRFLKQGFETNQLSDSREWSTMNWLNYEYAMRLDFAAGVGFGYVDMDIGSDMTYEQLQGRIRWRATDKTSFIVNGGFEERQFLDGGADDLLNPIFGASVQYQPFEFTTISLNANRAVAASYFQNRVTESTSFNGSLNQRLLKILNLNVGGGYRTSRFVDSASGGAAGRDDETYSFNASLSGPFLRRGRVTLFYNYSDTSSDQAEFAYSSSQVGIELHYAY